MTKAYFFKNNEYHRHTIGDGADSGYPRPLSNWDQFLANGVDAAVNWGIVNGKPKAYFFKGTEYLRWTIGEGADLGYPRQLSNWDQFLANGVDAAVNWGISGGKPKAYFFKGTEYLRWTIGEGADPGYPKQLSEWHPFLANGVDAAVNWGIRGGKPRVYFFKGNEYARHTIGEGIDPSYPKSLSNWYPFMANGIDAAVNWSMNMGDIYRYFRQDYTQHSNTNAYLLSLLSLDVYEGNPFGSGTFEQNFKFQFQNLSSSNPFDVRQFDSNTTPGLSNLILDTQAAVLSNSDMTLVVFRGSENPLGSIENIENIRDWIVDIAGAAPEKDWDNEGILDMARIHSGFKKSVDAVYDEIVARVSANGNRPVFVTGHSLGGSLALLCAYKFRAVNNINVGGIYTFAAPRPGNGHFRYKYDNLLGNRTFCWEYKNDPVPHFPPAGFLPFTPSHVGQLNRIKPNGTIVMDDNQPFVPIPNPLDHYMDNYVRVMKERLSDENRTSVNSPNFLVEGDAPDMG